MESDEHRKRAENEAAFREANERIEAAAIALAPPLERVPFLCECDDVACRETIPLTRDEYEHIRAAGARFVAVPGHEGEGEVVEQRGAYVVIRKTEMEGEIAESLDPRATQ